jgi:condensin-2 complex subunit D3
MAHCLQDPDPTVRKNALILLTQLLLQDYLKWKGFLLYRFLALTVDNNAEISEFSR